MATTIKATVSGGRLKLDVPVDWPDGTEVQIQALHRDMYEDCDTLSAEEIERTLAAMDRIEPLQMSDSELAAWDAERESQRDRDKAAFIENAEKLGRMWP